MSDKPECDKHIYVRGGSFLGEPCGKTAAYADDDGRPNTRCKAHSAERSTETLARRRARMAEDWAKHERNVATTRLTDAVVHAAFSWADGRPGGSDSLAEAVVLLRRHLGTDGDPT